MASVQPATSVFFQLFQAHCGHSDLGQINVNWFEELTREAIRLQPRLHEDEEKRGGRQDTSLFKTPQHKRSLCSQLESTPSIFREQSLCSPLFRSPTKDHEKSHVSAEIFFRNVLATELSPDTSSIPPNETFGTSSRYLADSPVVMKQLFKAPFGDGKYLHTTPRQDRKFDMSDSLLCTPQLIRDQSSRCISESLGVEADPEMSWSSSLATPPSPTVIIAQAKEEVCKLRKYDREDVLIVHSLFSKKNNVAEAVSSAAPDTKTDRDSTKFANTMTNENMEKSSDYLKAQQKKTVVNAVGDGEACQVVENAIEGMEDVLSIFFTNEKPPELRKIKVDRRIKRKIKLFSSVTGKNDSLIENTEEQTTTFTSENLKIPSKLLEQKACLREVSLSYEWTPLNLPDITQEENVAVEIDASSNTMENSTCNDSHLHRDEHTSKASNETNKYGQDGLLNSSQYMEHKEKSEERLPDDAAGDSEPLISGDLSFFATEGDFPWKSSSIAEQKHKLILSTLKKQNRFLYSLEMDYQQSETTEKMDTTLHGEPSKGLETPDAQSKRSLDLKNAASPLPEIKQVEKDDDFKDNSVGFQEILEEEAFLNITQTDPTATSGVKSAVSSVAGNCTELQVAKSESISQIEYEASQHSEGMVAHSNTKARVLDSVTRDHSVHEDPYTSRKECDSICSTLHPGKAESKSANRSLDLPAEIKMLSFVGFKTASNKKIDISEDNLRKAELLLKEDEALPISNPAKVVTGDKNSLNLMDRTDDTMTHMEFHRASPKEMVPESRTAKVNVLLQEICQTPSKRCKTNNTHDQTTTDIKLEHDEMTGSVEPNASRNLPEVSHEDIKEENKTEVAANTRKQPCLDSKSIGDIGFKENSMQVLNLQGIESHLYDVFTESQKAEINELSSILENAGSQFDFTQVKKLNLLGLDHENMQNPKKSISESQKLNTSDVWEDVDFNDSFATGEGNLEGNVLCVLSEPENKSDIKTNACNITDNNVGFKRGDGTVSGFTSGKSVNITDEDLVKAIEMFSDLEEKAEGKMTKTAQDLHCSPRPQTVSGPHLTANDRTATQSVSNVSNTMQATTSPKLAQSKEKYFSDIEFYSNQEDGCKSKENHATKLQPRRERPSSERSLSLLVEGVQNCDIASSSYENSASASGLSTMPVGFATGKGKAININKATLDKARTMFSDILDLSDPGEDHCRTPPVHGPSGLLTNAPQANNTFAEKETHGPRSYHGPEVSSKESKVPKVILDGPPQEENQKLHVLRRESSPPWQDNLISNRSLFSTASGKSLQLSEEGLKRAYKVFSDVDDVHVGDQQTGIVSREPTVNSGGLLDLKNKSVLVKETTFNFPQPGFSTANGKFIGVSQKCLQKARELFSDLGEPNDLDVGQRNPSSQSIAQVRRNKPLVNQVTADVCSEILADLPPLENLPNKEMSNKTSSGEHEIPEMSVMSLSTAGGKSILLSEDSLRKAQGMFSNIDDNLPLDEGKRGSSVNQIERKNPKSTFQPLGFSTASGRAVAVSLSSVQKARQMFAATVDTVSDTGLTYQSTKSLTRKEDTLEPNQCLPISNASSSLKPALDQCTTDPKGVDTSMCFPQQETSNRKMAFFSTASGSHVHLSSKALQKAREMFADLDDGQVDQPLQENVKEKAEMMDFSSKNPDNTMQVNAQGVASLSVGFNTASGKTVTVSHDSLQKAKLLFADADEKIDPANSSQDNTTKNINQREETGGFSVASMCQTSKTRSSVSNFSSSEGNECGNNTREPVVEDGCVPKTPCFSTAGGKTVTVSKESLKRVREIFSEVDDHCSSQHDATVDMQPNPISTSAAKVSLRENKEPEPSEIQHSSNVLTKNSFGFSTASGKQVCVSEDALQKVKSFFEEFDTNENLEGNLNENQDSARIHTLNPLLNKQHLKVSVTKLDHRQKNTVEGKKTTSTKSSCSSSVPPPGLVKHSTPLYGAGSTHLYFTSSHTPENEIEIEAAESAKAFMDDEDLTDAELKADGLFLCPDKLPNIRNGKRFRSDDGMGRGEPPIKRQLLPEFDRSLENESKPALKPLTSSPHERLKDRRKFLYKTSLQPLSSDPASFSKGKEATPETMHAPPSYAHSKLIGSRSSLPGSSAHISADCRNDRDNVSKTVTTSFVTPFKKDPHVSSGNQMVNSPRQDQDYSRGLLSKSRMEVGASQKDESGPDFSNLVENICCARDMQEMRIRKKQRQKIKPQPGSLYLQKTSSAKRIDLVTAVEERQPTVYTQAELYRCGVIKNHIGINSETARTFEFHCLDYFTRERFLSEGGVQIADGGWLVPTDKLSAGREEFYRALCDTPGVDPKLIGPEWVYNHYQWIVWKLAAMEVKFPMTFAGRCLTPDRVLLQLKYRYDVEIDKCRRSAVKKIMERDDTPAKTLVLCISKILTLGNYETSDTKQTSAIIEVTDGWYGIKALLDPALTSLLKKGRMFIGQKIIVHGAELVGSDDACTPLEAPDSLMLKIAGNSTRPARWYTKLGYFHDPRPFCLHLSSLLAEGGIVGCVDVLIQRSYPIQWMEKMGNGTYVFRNERAEEREAEKHSVKQQKNLEVLYVKIQEEYEKEQVSAPKRRPRRQSLSEPQIRALQDGAELYEALQNEPDPSYLESSLSSDQLRALNNHRQVLNDKRQAQIQADFRKAIESSEQEPGGSARRDVTPVWKIRIVDYKDHDCTSAYMLNIWRPLPDVVSLLKEGGRFKIYQLAASQSKGKSDTAAVQLTATKKTQFQQLQPLQHLEQIYTDRQVTPISHFLEPHFTAAYGEVDVVGLVVSTQQKPGAAPLVYMSDETCNVVALKFYTDLGQLALEELTRPHTFISAANLRWRSEYVSGVPTVFAGDLSFVTANPKEHHLQKAIQKLRQSIESVPEFCKEMENKLMNVLQAQNPQDRASLACCSVDPRSHLVAGSRCSTPGPKINNLQMKPVSTPAGSNTVLNTSMEFDPKTCKKMKGLDYLSRIPSPAPLTPVGTILSPSIQRAFRPPRSLHKEDRTCAKTTPNPDSSTPGKLEGGFVADEELAMINTQALVSGLEGGGKLTSERDIQKKITPNVNCPESGKAQVTEEEPQVPYQRRLCRKRKQKP